MANVGLFALCCFFVALIVREPLAQALEVPPEAEATRHAPPAPVARTWAERAKILERELFGPAVASSAPAPAPEPANLEDTRLALRLIGTVAGDPSFAWAAVEDLDSRQHLVVRIGDRLKSAEVLRIERKRLVLENNGRMEQLSLDEDEGNDTRRVARRTPARTTRRRPVRQLSDNRFSVPRGAVENVAQNPAELFSQARILPKYENGEMQGVQLSAIKPGSLFESIGIQNGDVIKELNGIEITSQQESARVLRELTQAKEFNVTVVDGNGNERELYYEVD